MFEWGFEAARSRSALQHWIDSARQVADRWTAGGGQQRLLWGTAMAMGLMAVQMAAAGCFRSTGMGKGTTDALAAVAYRRTARSLHVSSVSRACDNICHNVTKFASISHASTLGSFVAAVGFWRWCHRSCTTLMDPADGSKAVSAEIRRFCGAPGWTTEGVRVSKHQKRATLALSDASLAWPPREQGAPCGSRCGRGGHH